VRHSDLQWDNVVALGYAAEQLFLAGQLLTSDVIPTEHAVREACERHMRGLLVFKKLLPGELVRRLEFCWRKYSDLVRRNMLRERDIEELRGTVLSVLDDVRRELNEVAQEKTQGTTRLPEAA
jgi:hypothetical protein